MVKEAVCFQLDEVSTYYSFIGTDFVSIGCYFRCLPQFSINFDDQRITLLLLMVQTLYNSTISVVCYSLVHQLIDYPSNYVVGICTFMRRICSPPELPICSSKSPERACENILFFVATLIEASCHMVVIVIPGHVRISSCTGGDITQQCQYIS